MESLEILRRTMNKEEVWQVLRALERQRDAIGNKFIDLADTYKMHKQLLRWDYNGQVRTFVRPGTEDIVGIVGFDVVVEWWSTKRFLTELFVWCVDTAYKGFGRVAVAELEKIAEFYKCAAIIAGNCFMGQPQVVSNTYRKAGFEVLPVYLKLKE